MFANLQFQEAVIDWDLFWWSRVSVQHTLAERKNNEWWQRVIRWDGLEERIGYGKLWACFLRKVRALLLVDAVEVDTAASIVASSFLGEIWNLLKNYAGDMTTHRAHASDLWFENNGGVLLSGTWPFGTGIHCPRKGISDSLSGCMTVCVNFTKNDVAEWWISLFSHIYNLHHDNMEVTFWVNKAGDRRTSDHLWFHTTGDTVENALTLKEVLPNEWYWTLLPFPPIPSFSFLFLHLPIPFTFLLPQLAIERFFTNFSFFQGHLRFYSPRWAFFLH